MGTTLTPKEQEIKLAELYSLLNDPGAPVDPDRVWTLLAELETRKPTGAPLAMRRRVSLRTRIRHGGDARRLSRPRQRL